MKKYMVTCQMNLRYQIEVEVEAENDVDAEEFAQDKASGTQLADWDCMDDTWDIDAYDVEELE